ncbi:MAG: phytase [Bacteroidetes bacterium]|nr:phytase [Bacteroidota bacterium]
MKLNGLTIGINVFMLMFFLTSCEDKAGRMTITAIVETEPVAAGLGDDAADDPAIWIHPEYPDSSTIIGTNKKSGLGVYDLNGRQKFFYPAGRINNVDVRYGFPLNDSVSIDIAAGGNRSNLTIEIFAIDSRSGALTDIAAREISIDTLGMTDAYGFCLYRNPATGQFFAYVNDTNGNVQQWQLLPSGEGKADAVLVRHWKLDSQVEGMVCDDANGSLFIGEEGRGIWRFPACPDKPADGFFIPNSGSDNPDVAFDIEGLALFITGSGNGYLVASSQGNNGYLVFKRNPNHEYLGIFRVADGVIDGTEGTDGIEITSFPLGSMFPGGLMVIQDDVNTDGETVRPQNFKLVSWRTIADYFTPPLSSGNEGYNPRN